MGSAFSQQQPLSAQPRTPGGRLTLATGTPVMATEQAAKTNIYYTPYVNDQVPIYDGTNWVNKTFSELTLALASSANWASGSNYDLYVVNDGGTLRLGTGAAWTNDTTRAESLTRVNGIYTNNASMTLRYAASSTLTAAANTATYVGTFRASANGTTTWELGGSAAGGDPGFLYLWNCYHRVRVAVVVHDSTDSWTYDSTTPRSKDNSTSNRVSFVFGLSEDFVHSDSNARSVSSSSAGQLRSGVGLDVTNANSGTTILDKLSSTPLSGQASTSRSDYDGVPGIGYHFLQAVESAELAETHTTYGDNGGAVIRTALNFSGMF